MNAVDDDFLFVDHELIACYGHICAFFENTLSIERGRGTEFWRTSGREAKHLMQAREPPFTTEKLISYDTDKISVKHMGCATCGRASIGYPEIHDLNSPEGYLKVDFIDRPDCFGPCNPNSRRKAVVAGNAADETEPMDPIHSENVGIQDEHRDKLCCRRHSRSQYYYCEFIDRYGPNTDNCEGPGKSQEGFPKNLYPDKYRGSKQGEHGVHWLKEKPPIDASRPQGFRL